jgi:hypothetical protein
MSYQHYKDVISAKNRTWKSEARKLLESNSEFLVIHLQQEDFRDCKALAQEFDYDQLHEEASVADKYPAIKPSQIGFVKRTRPKSKS